MRADYTHLKMWKQRVAEWQNTGKSGKTWCREKDIPYQTFIYWRNKIEGKKTEPSLNNLSTASFTELSDQASEQTGIELICNDVIIRLSRRFDQQTLRLCLQVLRAE